MEKAKWARKAETSKQPSLGLKLRAPYLYPDRRHHSKPDPRLDPTRLPLADEKPAFPMQAQFDGDRNVR
jgi:hypothetical protein